MESWLFLSTILIVALIAKNNSLALATIIVMILKIFSPITSNVMTLVNSKGINWGILLITVSILIPIATGEITFSDLLHAFKTPIGWIAIVCGVLVAIFSAKGVSLIHVSPQITVALVIGTIIGVVFFKGLAAGPVIAAGMTYVLYQCFQMLFK